MHQPTPPPTASMASLPPEILLNIIPYVSYSPQALLSLRLIDRKLNHLIKSHETSLVSAIKHHQPSLRAQSRLFPDHALTTYTALSHLHARLSTLTEINALWLTITSHGMELHWLKGRWERIHKAGLLLLYRLHDCGPSHAAKLALLHHRLPATSLACLLFKLISSIKVLRVYGPTPIHARTGENGAWCCHHQDRNDVELACEEMLLREGPDFFVALLKAGRTEGESGGWAVTALETEIQNLPARQMPLPCGCPPPPTLLASLRRALAERTGCELAQTGSKMWEVLSSTAFDEVDEGMMERLVAGEGVELGLRRMGF